MKWEIWESKRDVSFLEILQRPKYLKKDLGLMRNDGGKGRLKMYFTWFCTMKGKVFNWRTSLVSWLPSLLCLESNVLLVSTSVRDKVMPGNINYVMLDIMSMS